MTKPKRKIQPQIGTMICSTELANRLIHEHVKSEPWHGNENDYQLISRYAVRKIRELLASGMSERTIIASARRYITEWFAQHANVPTARCGGRRKGGATC